MGKTSSQTNIVQLQPQPLYNHLFRELFLGLIHRSTRHRSPRTVPHSKTNMVNPKPTILVTGCSQGGIGDALVHQFASRGYRVLAGVRDPAKAAHLAGVPDVEVLTLDVAAPESVRGLAAELPARLAEGNLDVLINNAGYAATGPLLDADLGEAKTCLGYEYLGNAGGDAGLCAAARPGPGDGGERQ